MLGKDICKFDKWAKGIALRYSNSGLRILVQMLLEKKMRLMGYKRQDELKTLLSRAQLYKDGPAARRRELFPKGLPFRRGQRPLRRGHGEPLGTSLGLLCPLPRRRVSTTS